MNARTFFDLVVETREAQKAFFKSRSSADLIKARQLEAKVDAEIDRVQKILAGREAADALRIGNTMRAAEAIAKHMKV